MTIPIKSQEIENIGGIWGLVVWVGQSQVGAESLLEAVIGLNLVTWPYPRLQMFRSERGHLR